MESINTCESDAAAPRAEGVPKTGVAVLLGCHDNNNKSDPIKESAVMIRFMIL